MLYTGISVYNTCTLLQHIVKHVDANLDAPDNAISGNEPSSKMLTYLYIYKACIYIYSILLTGVDGAAGGQILSPRLFMPQ